MIKNLIRIIRQIRARIERVISDTVRIDGIELSLLA